MHQPAAQPLHASNLVRNIIANQQRCVVCTSTQPGHGCLHKLMTHAKPTSESLLLVPLTCVQGHSSPRGQTFFCMYTQRVMIRPTNTIRPTNRGWQLVSCRRSWCGDWMTCSCWLCYCSCVLECADNLDVLAAQHLWAHRPGFWAHHC